MFLFLPNCLESFRIFVNESSGKMSDMRILFLSNWYPNRYDAMEGLFVRKHAEAASSFAEVSVIFVKCSSENRFELEENWFKNVREITVYFPDSNVPVVGKLIKTINWLRAYWRGFKHLKSVQFRPDLTHANILTRTALIAFFAKCFRNIPYVVTEHWSRYLKERNSYDGWLRKRVTEVVVRSAEAILPVSTTLQNAMIEKGLKNDNYQIVNNVVDDFFFESEILNEKHEKMQFLHISCFCEEAKNVKGILDAVRILEAKRNDFELTIIGTGVDFDLVYDYAKKQNLLGRVHFLGEKSPEEVMEQFRHSDAFVLNSNFETSCVVIMESLACGKPVITTPVGIAPQTINEGNGRFVPFRDSETLAKEMEWMMDHHKNFDAEKIRQEAKIFSYNAISEQLRKIYQEAISRASNKR